MYSSAADSGVMQPEECSGSGSNLLVPRNRRNLRSVRRQQAGSSIGLLSLASEEDEDVQFDSKQQLFFILLSFNFYRLFLLFRRNFLDK